ncbi:MAG: ABC transporter permease [Alphaproteobacteria bacterium]|nr:MAG: ABC transporter permease [Alphaproteobacteria bacterium]
MDLAALDPLLLLASLLAAATPLIWAAMGELVVERSGVLNLGVEGMMIIGAIAGFAAAVATASPALGFLAAAAAGAALALLFGLLTQILLANQVATGLALTMFGLGLAALIGQPYSGIKPPPATRLAGQIDVMVPLGLALAGAVWWFLARSRPGLILRAVGENHDAAHALGYPVVAIRLAAIAFGGACAGLGGAHLSLVRVPQWTEGMTAGAGWIALAIVVFASWRPARVVLGAWLFGGVTILQLNLQALGLGIGSAWMSMAPYLMTILVLVLISAGRSRAALGAPACLGRVFDASG